MYYKVVKSKISIKEIVNLHESIYKKVMRDKSFY